MSARVRIAISAILLLGGLALFVSVFREPRSELPESYLGRWYEIDSSGGLTGEVVPAQPGTFLVVRPTAIEQHAADDTPIVTTPFELTRGSSIFGDEHAYLLDASGVSPRVIALTPEGVLTISDNVYDGMSSRYRREP